MDERDSLPMTIKEKGAQEEPSPMRRVQKE